MRIETRNPPRRYKVGSTEIFDCAAVELAADEQITFKTAGRDGYDVTRKDWGWYATPSLNGRLAAHGLRAVLAQNDAGRAFVLLVDAGREAAFEAYLAAEKMKVVAWLESDQAVAALTAKTGN